MTEGAPPSFTIVSPKDGAVIDTDKFILELDIKDQGGGIGDAIIDINGTKFTEEISSNRFVSRPLPLGEDINNIVISVTNENRSFDSVTQSISLEVSEAFERKRKLYIMSIAVEKYEDREFNLNFSIEDQNSLISTFEENIKDTEFAMATPIKLFDRQVTRERIKKEFEKLRDIIEPSDMFILHISGHGAAFGREYYFLPPSFKLLPEGFHDSVRARGIPSKDFRNWLNGIHATRSILIFDTCHSGELTKILGKELDSSFKTFEHKTGRVLIAASTPQGLALEGYNKHSILTYSFLEALAKANYKDEDKAVYIGELTKSIADLVETNSKRLTEKDLRFRGVVQEASILNNGQDFKVAKKSLKSKSIDFGEIPIVGSFVSNDSIEVFASPDSMDVISILSPYVVFQVDKYEGDWAKIKTNGNVLGFVERSKVNQLEFH